MNTYEKVIIVDYPEKIRDEKDMLSVFATSRNLYEADLALLRVENGVRYIVIKDRHGEPGRYLTRKEVEEYFVELL